MIWKIYKNNSEVIHYIMGTMHMSTHEAFTYADMAKKYIGRSSRYIAEMDLGSVNPNDVLASCLLPDNQNLSLLFRPKSFNKIVKIFKKSFDIDISLYDTYSPFYINNLLTDKAMKKTYSQALDHYLWGYAVESQKEMGGLETFEDQKFIISQIPIEIQLKALKSCAKNPALFRKKIIHLNSLYKAGDVKQLYKSSKRNMGALRKLMIYDRNHTMTQRLLGNLKSEVTFVAVGAAHLPGKEGMLSLIKKAGFKVKLLKS